MDDATRKINARMLACLTAGDSDGFFQIAITDLKRRIVGDLTKNMRMSPQDAEDCVFEVLKNIYIRQSSGNFTSPASPVDYLWQASRNQALTLINRRTSEAEARGDDAYLAGNGLSGFRRGIKSLSQQDAHGDGGAHGAAQAPMPPRAAIVDLRTATVLVESLLDDTEGEPEPGRLVEVVALAISRLTPPLAEVTEYLLRNGFEVQAEDAARELEIAKPATFRKRKERAYAQLRIEIPRALKELGVSWRNIYDAVEAGRAEFPSDDDDGADMS
jgi:DNA-directed RNA polymerase specialized sigma24 family protein